MLEARSTLDRCFFPGMAYLFLAVAVVGFGPNSLAILAGTKTNPPLIIHFHAAAMTLWLALLCAQATLIGLRRLSLHRQLGMAILFLAPVVIVIMFVIAVSGFPGFDTPQGAAIAIIQAKRIILFSLFCALAFSARHRDLQAHKRLMLLATYVVLDAAFFRMEFLPSLGFGSSIETGLAAQPVLLLPVIAFDLATLGRLHRSTVIGLSLIVPFTAASLLLW